MTDILAGQGMSSRVLLTSSARKTGYLEVESPQPVACSGYFLFADYTGAIAGRYFSQRVGSRGERTVLRENCPRNLETNTLPLWRRIGVLAG